MSLDALALGATLDVPDLGALLAGSRGPVRVEGELAGPPGAPGVVATLTAAEGLSLPGSVRVASVAVDARVSDPFGRVDVDAAARLTGLAVGDVAGDVSLAARGPAAALALTAEAGLHAGGEPLRVGLDGRLDALEPALVLERLEAAARGETLRLLAPARLDLSDGLAVDRLRLGLRQGTVEVSGRLAPALALDANVTGIPADLLRLVLPGPALAGTLGAEARLSASGGSLAGSVRAQADGLRLTEGPGRGLPPASVELTANLGPDGAEIDARGTAGTGARVGLTGRVGSTLDLRADGRIDLALLDPMLAGSGRGVRGNAALDARIGGTLGVPRLDGAVRLADGAYWDRSIGLVLTELQGRLALTGETLRAEPITARAGPGTLALEGTVGVLAPGIPVDLRLTARDARPLQRDEVDLKGSGELRLTGSATQRLALAGALRLDGVEIRLPERLPAAIATLEVRETGQRRAPPPGARAAGPRRLDLDLDLALSAPRKVVVQGRGVDAELGGEGTARRPGRDRRLRARPRPVQPGRPAPALLARPDRVRRRDGAGSDPGSRGAHRRRRGHCDPGGVRDGRDPPGGAAGRAGDAPGRGPVAPVVRRAGRAPLALAGAPGAGALTRVGRALGLGRLGLVANEKGDAAIEGGRDVGERAYLGARQSSRTGEPQGVLRFEASRQIRLEADVSPIGGTRAGVAFEHEF